jgi:hypothetical protein
MASSAATWRWLQVSTAVGLLAVSHLALAFSFGIGVEGGATSSYYMPNSGYLTPWSTLADPGVILTQRFALRAVDLTLWEDINFVAYDNWIAAFFPVDVGLRVGLPGPIFRPYIGLLVSAGIALLPTEENTGCRSSCTDPEVAILPGLGGDLGLDVAVTFLRFGIEVRAYETLVPPLQGATAGDGFALQTLLSVRAEL